MGPIEKRLRASVRLDAVNGSELERSVCAGQMSEAAAEIERLRMERDAALAQVAALRSALAGSQEWIDDSGCYCGVDEPGTCAWCVAAALLADTAEVAKGWLPPDIARQVVHALKYAESRLEHETWCASRAIVDGGLTGKPCGCGRKQSQAAIAAAEAHGVLADE